MDKFKEMEILEKYSNYYGIKFSEEIMPILIKNLPKDCVEKIENISNQLKNLTLHSYKNGFKDCYKIMSR